MRKRNDIQWLRALAIIAVLGFHIWPEKFPYGYLGVDIFFVISGYLMTSILEKSTNNQQQSSGGSLIHFYSRRIQRIFPTCLLTIFIFLLIGFFVLLPSHFEFLKIEALWSALFLNNFSSMITEKPYFELVSEFKFFLHTWSLGVEIQFYLIAPFLIKFILSRSKSLHWIGLLAIISALSQFLIPYETISFGLMFCRIWQFLIGTAAFCFCRRRCQEQSNNNNVSLKEKSPLDFFVVQNKDEMILPLITTKTEIKNEILEIKSAKGEETKYFENFIIKRVSILLITITLFPISFANLNFIPALFRLMSTALAGVFITLNGIQPISLPKFLDSLLVYIGDASYAIYLIHWPIVIYFKYFNIFETYGAYETLICIIIVGVMVHEIFEKPMQKRSEIFNGLFIIFSYCFIFYITFYAPETWNNNSSPTTPIKYSNEEDARSCKAFYPNCTADPLIDKYLTNRPSHHGLDKYCSFQLDPTSNKTALITGNSFVYFQIRGIMDAIKQSKHKFSKVYVVAHPGCSILGGSYNKNVTRWYCQKFDGSHDNFLKVLNPDLHIHTARLDHIFDLQMIPPQNMPDDPTYNEIVKSISFISNHTKRLIIVEPTPILLGSQYKSPYEVAHTILTNGSFEKYNITIEKFRTTQYPSWNRVKEAVKKCNNCALVATEKLFCKDTFCPLVDMKTKLGRYCDIGHITPRESLLLTPGILEAINKKTF